MTNTEYPFGLKETLAYLGQKNITKKKPKTFYLPTKQPWPR